MKILEIFFNKSNAEQRIIVDMDGEAVTVYVTKHGLQILNLAEDKPNMEQAKSIMIFVDEFLKTIEENKNETTEQSSLPKTNQESDDSNQITQSADEANPQSN